MAETAAASGAANNASVVAGPAMPPHLELAVKLADLNAAEEATERMRRKLAKAKDDAKTIVATATEGLAQAQSDEKAARQAVNALAGEHGAEAVAALQAAAREAQAQADAAQRLLEGGN